MTRLSVVVTLVDGGAALERCLTALASQESAPALEVLVPYDDTVRGLETFVARFPHVRFLALGHLPTARPWDSPVGQHELFDRRRTAGLRAATGGLVALLADRGVPRPDWAARIVDLHARLPHLVIGGAIENGRDALLNRAVHATDFARYQLPFDAGFREYVSDLNLCYKPEALDRTRSVWEQRYHETTVHWALLRAGVALYLSPDPVVEEIRDGLTLAGLLRERVGFGRLFAYTRVREISALQRAIRVALTPILPLVLFGRLFNFTLRKNHGLGAFLSTAPVILLLLAAWSLGEMLGYLTGEP